MTNRADWMWRNTNEAMNKRMESAAPTPIEPPPTAGEDIGALLDALYGAAYEYGHNTALCEEYSAPKHLAFSHAVTEARAALDRALARLTARGDAAERALDEEVAERERREEQIESIYYELGGEGEWSSACDLGDEALNLAEAAAHDSSLIDRLEAVMRPKDGYVEVYLAGLRPGYADATGYQVEFQPLTAPVTQAHTLREALRAALTPTEPPHA